MIAFGPREHRQLVEIGSLIVHVGFVVANNEYVGWSTGSRKIVERGKKKVESKSRIDPRAPETALAQGKCARV